MSKLLKLLLFIALAGLAAGCGDDPKPAVGPSPGGEDAGEPEAEGPDASEPEPEPEPEPPLDLSQRLEAGQVRAGVIEGEGALIGGVKADGKVGDAKIYNAHVAFVIEGVREATGGYRFWGGNIVDADVVRPEGEPGQDLFGEIGHSWNLNIFMPEELEVVNDGRDGRPAHIRVTGRNVPFDWAESFVRAFIDPGPVQIEATYDYILGAEDRALRHVITTLNVDDEPTLVDFPLVLSNQGDGIRQWQTGKGFDISMGPVDRFQLAGRGPSYALIPMDTSLTLLFEYNNVELLIHEGFTLEAGASTSREFRFAVTDRGVSGLAEIDAGLRGGNEVESSIKGQVALPDSADPATAFVVAWVGELPLTFAPVEADGSFELGIQAGTYRIQAFVSGHAGSNEAQVSVEAGQRADLELMIPRAATVHVTIKNDEGEPVPARVTLVVAEDDATTPEPYAPSGVRLDSDGAWRWTSASNGGKISAVGYAGLDGAVAVGVPAGTYRVLVSRGFSWEVAEQTVTVGQGERAELEATINKVVDTTGWLSADFHIHALRSPDSDTPYEVRVRQALTDDLDIPVMTEHVTLTGLQDTADGLGLGEHVIGPFGQEVTTFEYGHFNAFPLLYEPEKPNTGGIFPYDKRPDELFAAIRAQQPEDEIIQINHPRGSNLGSYFSYVGYDRATGEPANPEGWSTNWDSIEVFNGRCSRLGSNEALDDWIAMTNSGLIRTLGSGSDSHRENDPIGMPRNWIRIDAEALKQDHQLIVGAVRSRQIFVTCGPFVRFEAEGGAISLGQRTAPDAEGHVEFRVQVQAPDWIRLDEARLIRNGVPIDSLPIQEQGSGVRLEATFTDRPEADAWYALEVIGSGSMLPVHANGPPYAFTNPIEVDVDGDGNWTPPGL